jgi:voltage-gated potassium channel
MHTWPARSPHRPPHARTGRARVFDLLAAGGHDDPVSRAVDAVIVGLVLLTWTCLILLTVDSVAASLGWLLNTLLVVAVVALTAEYGLRLWSCTAEEAYEDPVRGRLRFALTPLALADLFAIAPFHLGLVVHVVTLGSAGLSPVLKLLLLALFLKLVRYSTALRTLSQVLYARRSELGAVLVVNAVLLVAVSSTMYFLEGDVQPEAFSSIPDAMWWGLVTMTTVGYGDVTPATEAGRVVAGFAALLGVAMFALPAGVLGAGFAEAFQEAHDGSQPP